jgi:phosphopantetheine adenylyltransferase
MLDSVILENLIRKALTSYYTKPKYHHLIKEGGVAGHMNHLYDNGELTFRELKLIMTRAAQGELVGTEKTDGQNIQVSFSVKDQRAVGARNKQQIMDGGLTSDAMFAFFTGHPSPVLKHTFSESIGAFENACKLMDSETQIELFGEDASTYYNCEILDQRTPNVINYDTNTLLVHPVGHGKYDRTTGKKTNEDISQKAAYLRKLVNDYQDKLGAYKYGVKVNDVRQLQAFSDKQSLRKYIELVDSIIQSHNLTEEDTIDNLVRQRIKSQLHHVELPEEKIELLLARLLEIPGVTTTKVVSGLSPNEKALVKGVLENQKEILKQSILPLEEIVSDFAAEMLKTLKSAFMLDNDKEVIRLRKEVQDAIDAIQNSGNQEAMDILQRQLRKLIHVDKIATAAEGFVFDYNGVTYKFTGNFAPVNQILGLFKYGRGNVPALKKTINEDVATGLTGDKLPEFDVAIVPGAFKPPHKGHFELAKYYASMSKKVIIAISPKPPRYVSDNGRHYEVTADLSKDVWDTYINDGGLQGKVVLEIVNGSPVAYAFDYIMNPPEYYQGMKIALGVGDKDEDKLRFAGAQQKAKEGVEVQTVAMPPATESNQILSATAFRKAIASKDAGQISQFIPAEVEDKKTLITKLLSVMGANSISDEEMDALKKKRATRIANKLSNDPNVVQKLTEQLLTEHVRKVGNQYCLFSKKTGKKLGCYDSKKGVKKREKQVQYFKHAKGKKKLEEEGAANSMGAGGVQGYAGKYFKDEEF